MRRAVGCLVILFAACALTLHAQRPASRIQKLEELRWPQVDALDRERTMFILPIGMIEEHGPHLPVGADTLGVMFEANEVAKRVSRSRPQWRVVMMPPIHYGETGANEIAGDFIHPGTYGIRHTTLRALVADLGAQVAQNGFTWIFVLTGHRAPPHNIAINEACDFVSETFNVQMLHVSGLFRADAAIRARGIAIAEKHFSPADLASFGQDVHAGVAETSAMLALRRDLVDPGYTKLPPRVGQTREELHAVANAPGWEGYLSAPARAIAAYGRDIEAWWVDGLSDLILRAVGGENFLKAPRHPGQMDPAVAAVVDKALQNERVLESKLDAWLARRRQR